MQPRQLIVCSDGTNNNLTGGRQDTNVVKFIQWLGAPGMNQQVFYDPGVGNAGTLPGATLWDGVRRTMQRVAGLALGRGVYENVGEAYEFLMRNYQDGDELYFFGFSRGAFTARSVAGLVNQFGILDAHMTSMVPTLIHVYFSDRKGGNAAVTREVAAQIRERFCAPGRRGVKIHFVGVWDTVASVGMWPFGARMTAIPEIKGKNFVHIRQALALDEHRVPFRPRLYVDRPEKIDPGQTVVQRWFRGAHCDAGGGYPPALCAISNEALAWMLMEANGRGAGLRIDSTKVPKVERAAIVQALGPELIGEPPVVNSETYFNCLWAVAGLTVRRTDKVSIEGREDIEVIPVEHESVVTTPLTYPDNTVWANPRASRDGWGIAALAVAALVLYVGMGSLLAGTDLLGVTAWMAAIPEYLATNVAFAWDWQLLWTRHGAIAGFADFDRPRWALVSDLFFICAYATLLAWFVVRAFANVAGFTRKSTGPRRLLSLLGRALPVMVVADLAENLCTWLLITMHAYIDVGAMYGLGVLMSLAAVTKFAGLAGVILLLAWGLLFSRKKAEPGPAAVANAPDKTGPTIVDAAMQ